MTERKQSKEMGGDWRSSNEEFHIGEIKIFAVLFIYDSVLSEFSSSPAALLLSNNFSLFLPNSFFIRVVVKAYSHPSIEYLGSQDELSNYLSWKIPRIPRVYLQLIDLSDNKPDAWFIFKVRQYVK